MKAINARKIMPLKMCFMKRVIAFVCAIMGKYVLLCGWIFSKEELRHFDVVWEQWSSKARKIVLPTLHSDATAMGQ